MDKAILKTICYHAVFSYPLTPTEIWLHLVGPAKPTWRRQDLIPILDSLVAQKILTTRPPNYYTLGPYFISQPPLAQLIKIRHHRRQISRDKLILARKKTRFLTHLPGVRLVAITGSLAAHQATQADDIDLLVITSSGKLWQTRLIITLVADLLGRRRRPIDSTFTNQLCFNLYLDTGQLTIAQQKQNLYSAYELTSLIPLYDPANSCAELLQANSWAKHFQPHAYQATINSRLSDNSLSPSHSVLEKLSRSLQTSYMRRRLTTELITPYQLYLHPHDHSGYILTRYRQIYHRFRLSNKKQP